MSNYTPIKRSPHIVALSKDHHHALLLAWKIRQGIKNGVEIKRITSYTKYFYNSFLKEHFREEEIYLFCLLPEDDNLRIQAFSEHALLAPILECINTKMFSYEELAKIATILDNHIRFEERILFPHIERVCSEKQLEETAAALSHSHVEIVENWDDHFWKKDDVKN